MCWDWCHERAVIGRRRQRIRHRAGSNGRMGGWDSLAWCEGERLFSIQLPPTNQPANPFPFLSCLFHVAHPHAHVIDIDIYSIQDTALGFGLVAIAIILTVTVTFNPRQMVDGRVSSGGPLAVRLVQP